MVASVVLTVDPDNLSCDKADLDLEGAGIVHLELGNDPLACPCCDTDCCRLAFFPSGSGSNWTHTDWGYDCVTGDWFVESEATPQPGFTSRYRSGINSSNCSAGEITSEPANGTYPEGTIIRVEGTSTLPTCPRCFCPGGNLWQMDIGQIIGPVDWRAVFQAKKCDEPIGGVELCRYECSDYCIWICACGEKLEYPGGIGVGECVAFGLRQHPTCGVCPDGSLARDITILICRVTELNFDVTVTLYCDGDLVSDTGTIVIDLSIETPQCEDAIINGVFIQLGNSGAACECNGIPSPCCNNLLPRKFYMTLEDFFVDGASVPTSWTANLNRLRLDYIGSQKWMYRGWHHWDHPTILEDDTDWEWIITVECEEQFPSTLKVTIEAQQNNSPNKIIQGLGSGDNPCTEPASMRWTILSPGDYMDWLLEYE